MRSWRGPLAIPIVAALVIAACGGGGASTAPGQSATTASGAPAATSGGAAASAAAPSTLNVWVRQDTEALYQLLAKEYNKTHATQVVLTPIQQSDFVTKVSTAAATGTLPDVLSTDVAFVAGFVNAGVFVDTSGRINALPYGNALLSAWVKAASKDGAEYGVPAAIDVSTMYYNKDLFQRAGLNPDQPPTTWNEILQDAKTITALGGGVTGYYFAGQCGGCNGFDMLPMIWASGGENVPGASVSLNSPQASALMQFYHQMWAGGMIAPGAKTDTGASWVTAFETGKIGIAPYGGFALTEFKKDSSLHFGAFLIPGENGGTSSFAGGDVMGITKGAKNPGAAWDFIQWMLSNDVQLNVVAANGYLVDRTDLADNQYAQQDPLIALHYKAASIAQVPDTAYFNQLFTDPAGPWNALMQTAVFGGTIQGGLQTAQAAFNKITGK